MEPNEIVFDLGHTILKLNSFVDRELDLDHRKALAVNPYLQVAPFQNQYFKF